MRYFLPVAVLVTALSVAGCAATHTAIAKRDLDVQNKMTDTIFLDPVGPAQRTVYVQVRNSSDYAALDLAPYVVPGAVISATIVEPSNKNPETEGVAKIGGLVVFVKGATTPGQTVNVRIASRNPRAASGEVTSDPVTAEAPAAQPAAPAPAAVPEAPAAPATP